MQEQKTQTVVKPEIGGIPLRSGLFWISLLICGYFLIFAARLLPAVDLAEVIETSNTCLDCHDGLDKGLHGTVHELSTTAGPGVVVGCVSCHTGGEVHIEDPSTENIGNPSKLVQGEEAALCSQCHATPHQQSMLASDPHGRGGVSCSNCHSVHSASAGLVIDERQQFCYTCHRTVAAQFEARSAHPLLEESVRCTDCHNLGTNSDPLFTVGHNWTCQNCHGDKSGPFRFEHPVVYAHLVEGGGCVECHSPHGSANDRLLNQAGDGLCWQCHGTPPTHLIAHDGLATGFACVDCHTDIHGSYDNSKFLDPDLGMKMSVDCMQSGCHVIGE
ncbi:MAG: cytochrome c3 family protein [bacterium]